VWRTTCVTGVGRFSIIAVNRWLKQHRGEYLQPCGALTGHQQADAATLAALLAHGTQSMVVVQLENKPHAVALRYDTSSSRWLVLDSELPAPALLSTCPV
jgi:hypothetical protein